jgi:hypothetical protein
MNISRNDLLQVAKKMNIKKADAIIDQVHAAVSKWNEFAKQTNVKKDLKELRYVFWIVSVKRVKPLLPEALSSINVFVSCVKRTTIN